MAKYLVKQFLVSFIKLFFFLTFMFFFIQIMMPGDFVDQFSLGCDAACREAMREQLGLNLPIWERYFNWLGHIIRLDFGYSMSGEPIVEVLKRVIPATLLVFVIGTGVSFSIGLSLGKFIAWKDRRIGQRLITFLSLIFFTSFPPWLTYLVTHFLTKGGAFMVMGERGGLRSIAFRGLDRLLWEKVVTDPSAVAFLMIQSVVISVLLAALFKILYDRITKTEAPTFIFIILAVVWSVAGWSLIQIEELALDIMSIAYIPLIAYILLSYGEIMLIMQASLQDVKNMEFIQTARGKGLPESVVRDRHAVRNAILPVLSRFVISLPYLLTGVVIIESSVGWPGLGTNMWNALYWQNMPVVMNTLLIVGVISLLARLIIDLISAYLDPRIRHQNYYSGQP
jgi:peptide/nickel transport system permease protein